MAETIHVSGMIVVLWLVQAAHLNAGLPRHDSTGAFQFARECHGTLPVKIEGEPVGVAPGDTDMPDVGGWSDCCLGTYRNCLDIRDELFHQLARAAQRDYRNRYATIDRYHDRSVPVNDASPEVAAGINPAKRFGDVRLARHDTQLFQSVGKSLRTDGEYGARVSVAEAVFASVDHNPIVRAEELTECSNDCNVFDAQGQSNTCRSALQGDAPVGHQQARKESTPFAERRVERIFSDWPPEPLGFAAVADVAAGAADSVLDRFMTDAMPQCQLADSNSGGVVAGQLVVLLAGEVAMCHQLHFTNPKLARNVGSRSDASARAEAD